MPQRLDFTGVEGNRLVGDFWDGRGHPAVLLVRGTNSELVQEDFAREFVALAPDASYVDVSGAGHMVAGDRNDLFCEAILDFLTDREAA